jgi:iron complex outermembrane receptor protein
MAFFNHITIPIMLASRVVLNFFLSACAIGAMSAAHAQGLDDDGFHDAIPTVLTPVRLKQPRTEVPASVTVIDRQLIEASGARQLPELFRLVPGTSVGARDGWNYVVSYHGTTHRDSRRMQVMVDGRSVYQAGLATIDWADIPLAIEDIERIEIVRGPDTAAYGANAFLGVISIVTRHPDDSPMLRLKASHGSNNTEDYYGSTSGKLGESSFRISANGRRDAGFDHDRDGNDRRDSTNLQLFNTRWEVMPVENWSLDVQAGYKYGVFTENLDADEVTPDDHYVRDWFFSTTSQHFLSETNSLKWQFDVAGQHEETEWRSCLRAGDIGIPRAVLPRATLVCGDVNDNATNQRIDFDLQDTLIGVAPWKLVAGLHVQHQKADSMTFYQGTVERSTYQLFANYEYRFLPQWSFTLGGSQEYADTIGQNFSPRVALLFLPNEHHTVRAVYSEAIRTPDLFETDADWSYTAKNVALADGTPVPVLGSTVKIPLRAVAPGTFREENISSRELGYYGLWLDRRLQVDIKWFWDYLDDLTSSSLTLENFRPRNDGNVNQRGWETEVDFRATDRLRLRGTYALINSHIDHLYSGSFREYEFTPRKNLSLSTILDLAAGWQWSANYFYAYEVNEHKVSRLDTRLQKSFTFSGCEVRTAGTLQHSFSDDGDLFRDNLYDSDNRLLFTLDLIF